MLCNVMLCYVILCYAILCHNHTHTHTHTHCQSHIVRLDILLNSYKEMILKIIIYKILTVTY